MDKSWNFLKNNFSKGDQNILMQAMKACNIEVNTYEEALRECKSIYGNISYTDLLKKISTSLKISLKSEDLQSDRFMIGHIGYFLLKHDESFRLKFSSKELMPKDKEKFKLDFFLKLKTSEVFWLKIAMYVFWYYHMDVEYVEKSIDKNTDTADVVRNTFLVSVLPFATGFTSRIIGGIFRGAMFTAAIPAVGVALGVATSIYEINKFIEKSFVDKLPIHLTVVYLHLAHSYELSTIDEVKAILRTAIMNAIPKNVKGKYVWDDVRKGILQRIAPKLPVYDKKVVDCILANKSLLPSYPLETYIPHNVLKQIFKFNLKDLVDFIYGFDVPNADKSDFNMLGQFDYPKNILLVDYCFPYTKIHDLQYCLLSKEELDSSLTQLYYEFNGLNSKKLCLKNIEGHYKYIQLLDDQHFYNFSRRNCFDKMLYQDSNRIENYSKYADNVVYLTSKGISVYNGKEDEINRLKAEISSLKQRLIHLENSSLECENYKKRLQDQIEKCHRVKHDLEHLLGNIISPVKRYVKYKDNPKVKEEAFEKFKSSIHSYDILCKSWKILTQEEKHGELKKVSITEICEAFNNFTHKVDGVKHEIHNQISQEKDIYVYVSEHYELQVFSNIVSNLNAHAFVGVDRNRKLYSRISNDDVFVTISIENNGHPIEVNNPESLFQYRLPNKKGIGLSNIRDCMRYAKGDFRIEANTNNEYSTIYVLTFKIVK